MKTNLLKKYIARAEQVLAAQNKKSPPTNKQHTALDALFAVKPFGCQTDKVFELVKIIVPGYAVGRPYRHVPIGTIFMDYLLKRPAIVLNSELQSFSSLTQSRRYFDVTKERVCKPAAAKKFIARLKKMGAKKFHRWINTHFDEIQEEVYGK